MIAGYADFEESVNAFAINVRMWENYAAKQPPEAAVKILLMIGALRDATRQLIVSAIGPDGEPDFVIIDDAVLFERANQVNAGLSIDH
jgi:hypothetical protein